MISIGIDGRALQGHRTGIGRYVYELCRQLDKELPEARFFIYTNRSLELPCRSERWVLRKDGSFIGRFLKPVLWTKFVAGRLCKNDNLTLFWGPTTFLPHLPSSVKTIVTVHDINYLIVPKTMKYTHLWAHRLFFSRDLKNANAVIANSKGTAAKIKKYYALEAACIVYPAADKSFKPQEQNVIEQILAQLHIKKPYLLALGTLEPRKNIPLVIDAFLNLQQSGHLLDYHLVIVGSTGWKNKELLLKIKAHRSILTLGFVKDDLLPAIYSGADIFIFPSQYEGYGMPVREALQCGTKVVASDISEIREIGGGDNIAYVEPNAESVQKGILKLLTCHIHGHAALPEYSWNDGAKDMVKAFSSIS